MGAGYGFVLENCEGVVLKSSARPIHNATTTCQAKALAIQKSLEGIEDFWQFSFVVEFDCMELVDSLCSHKQNLSLLGIVLDNLKQHMDVMGCGGLFFSPRNNNITAHMLAKLGLSLISDVV